MATNKNKYKDPRWQKKRLEIMSLYGFRCFNCSATDKTLHVHHKKYSGEIWDDDDDALQVLCEECHTALGPHPKGGIWWEGEGEFVSIHCPMCGSRNTKDKGSFDKCLDCGHRIMPLRIVG